MMIVKKVQRSSSTDSEASIKICGSD